MNDLKRQQTDKLLVHLDNLERYLGRDKERENQDLRATIQEIRDRYEESLLYKEDAIRGLNEQIEELQACLQTFQKSNRGNENQIDDLRRENNHLKDSLIEKLAQDVDDELINREIRKVKDPSSFSALKAILSRTAKLRADADLAAQELQSVNQLKSKVSEGGAKQKELNLEIKSLRKKVEQLNTQNEFLLGELDFSRKKLQEGKGRVQKAGPQNNTPQTGDDSRALLEEVCAILKITNVSELVPSVQIIEEAYQLLPALQTTVESIFKIVYEGNIFDTPINSYDDLADAVDNWATNLLDYKNLVDGLVDLLEIVDEDKYTVSFILESVNRLRNQEGSVDFARRSRSQVESEQIVLMLKEMLKEGSKDRLLDQIAALQKRSLLLGSFIDEIKAKLHLNQSISDESVFTKLIRFLDVNTEK